MTITIPDPMEWPLWLDISLLVIAGYALGLVVTRMLLQYWGWDDRSIANTGDGQLLAPLMVILAPLVPPVALVAFLFWIVVCRWLIGGLLRLAIPRRK